MHADKWFQQLMIFEGIDVTSEPTCFNDSFYWQLTKMKLYGQKHFRIFLLIIAWLRKRYPENRVLPKNESEFISRVSNVHLMKYWYEINGLVLCKPSWANSEKERKWHFASKWIWLISYKKAEWRGYNPSQKQKMKTWFYFAQNESEFRALASKLQRVIWILFRPLLYPFKLHRL